jgi:hypothetical protein
MALDPDIGNLDFVQIVVEQQLGLLQGEWQRWTKLLGDLLGDLGDDALGQIDDPPDLTPGDATLPPVVFDPLPDYTEKAFTLPELPAAPDFGHLLDALDIGDLLGAMPAAPSAPGLNLPVSPVLGTPTLPQRPVVDMDLGLPAAPVLTEPVLEEINLPPFVFPTLPTFDATPPSMDAIAVPNVFVDWQEVPYESDLYDILVAKVKQWLAGGTGLPPHIEAAIFNRARERLAAETRRAVDEVQRDWAARGFDLPQGAEQRAIDLAREEGRFKAGELDRDLAIEAAKWEIENVRFALERGIQLEELAIKIWSEAQNRKFEAAKLQVESAISLYNAQISGFNARCQAFSVLADIYKAKLEGALAQLTAYKTAVEVQGLHVDVYKARLAGVQNQVEVFKALMGASQVKADLIKTQFDVYRTDIQAYAEQLSAERVKFEVYKTQVEAETAKTQMYVAETQAYANVVQAHTARAELVLKTADLRIEQAKLLSQEFSARIDAFKAQVEAGLSELKFNTEVFSARTEAWKAKASVLTAQQDVEVKRIEAQLRTNVAYSEMQVKQYEAIISRALALAQLNLEKAKAMGGLYAQLAAGAMSALSVQAGLSAGSSSTASYTKSENHSYNHNA